VTVIIPNPEIASRWNGALQARLRQSPLEAYLRSRGLKWVLSSETRLTDNLACAIIYIVNAALDRCVEDRRPLNASQHPAVGQIACAVGSNLALLVQEPTQWRTAALVATARLLEKHIGLSSAAYAAAAAAREYSTGVGSGTQYADVIRIGHAARVAVETNVEDDTVLTVRAIADLLESMPPHALPAIPTVPRSPFESLAGDLIASTVGTSTI
jgi:hypothetical protein